MKIQDQVITLEQAKRLKELGISQDSYFSWFGDETPRLMDNGADPMTYGGWVFVSTTIPANNQEADHRADTSNTKPIAAAFTVAELGVMLPPGDGLYSARSMPDGQWVVCSMYDDGEALFEDGETEAQVRAGHLIQLLESQLITAEDCNKRLQQ